MTRNPKPVETWLGSFPSQNAAAKAHGVSRQAMWMAERDGYLDRVGKRLNAPGGNPQPVKTWLGPFPSLRAASLAHGVHEGAIWNARRRGRLDRVGKGRGNPVETWKGPFRSYTEAAKAHGVSVATITRACRENRLDRIGKPRTPRTGYHVTVNGVEYTSICAAHRATGISRDRLMAMAMEGKR